MENLQKIPTIVFIVMVMASCGTSMPNQTVVETLEPTQALITPSAKPSSIQPITYTPSITWTPLPTLSVQESQDRLKESLGINGDCKLPCFLGIEPGHTTLTEALDIFSHLGLRAEHTTLDNKYFCGVYYEFEGGPSFLLTLTILDENVKNLRVDITPDLQKPDEPRSWAIYSPESLIARYGTPSRVDFFLGRHEPPRYSMQIYFETADLIIQYGSFDITFVPDGIQICPLVNQYDSVRVWLGKKPEYPPGLSVPLEESTSLSLEEFSELMVGNPYKSCFDLKEEVFP